MPTSDDRVRMIFHACGNCRRPLSASVALVRGKLCEKCSWAAGAAEFREDEAKTNPRAVAYNLLIIES